jgi:hypothetical protein
MTMHSVHGPRALGRSSMASHHAGGRRMLRHREPAVGLAAIGWPRTTSSPTRTIGCDGLPMCCDSGTTKRGAKGSRRIDVSAVCLQSGGCTPRWKASPRK